MFLSLVPSRFCFFASPSSRYDKDHKGQERQSLHRWDWRIYIYTHLRYYLRGTPSTQFVSLLDQTSNIRSRTFQTDLWRSPPIRSFLYSKKTRSSFHVYRTWTKIINITQSKIRQVFLQRPIREAPVEPFVCITCISLLLVFLDFLGGNLSSLSLVIVLVIKFVGDELFRSLHEHGFVVVLLPFTFEL